MSVRWEFVEKGRPHVNRMHFTLNIERNNDICASLKKVTEDYGKRNKQMENT